MVTQNCGGLPSQAGPRKRELTEKCQGVKADGLAIWNIRGGPKTEFFLTFCLFCFPRRSSRAKLTPNSAFAEVWDHNQKQRVCVCVFV